MRQMESRVISRPCPIIDIEVVYAIGTCSVSACQDFWICKQQHFWIKAGKNNNFTFFCYSFSFTENI